MPKRDVLCIGIACVDVLIKGADLTASFENESIHADSVTMAVGGDAANEAIVLSNLGHDTQLMCGIGSDGVGRFIREYVEKSGVDMKSSIEKQDGESAINLIIVHSDGQRNFINSGVPEAACFSPDISSIKDVRVVSMGSLFLPPFHNPDICLKTARAAKEEGAILCADVIVLPDSRLSQIGDALSYVDYIFPNQEEAQMLTGETILEEIADVFLNYGVKNVIIKTGKDGCYVKNADIEAHVSTYAVPNMIDTTGAGDNFAAGFMSGLLQGMDIIECCRYASGVAAVAIQSFGATTGVKSRQQVLYEIARLENR